MDCTKTSYIGFTRLNMKELTPGINIFQFQRDISKFNVFLGTKMKILEILL